MYTRIDPTIPFLEMIIFVYIKTCTWTFIATLFIIAKHWKQPEFPSTGKPIDKLCCQYNGILLSNKNVLITDINNNIGESQKNIKLHEKKPGAKECLLYDSIYMKSKKDITNVRWKTDPSLLRLDGGCEYCLPRGIRAFLVGVEGRGCSCGSDCRSGYLGICICQNLANCTLTIRAFIICELYLNYIFDF